MSNLPPVNYTNLDSETILSEMVSAINGVTNKWTDRNPSDVGMTLLELLAWTLEKLTYYLDKQANEAFFIRSRELKNVITHARLMGYKHHGIVSATTGLEFSIPGIHPNRIVIPKYTRCSTTSFGETIYFTTTTRGVIPVGDTSVLVSSRQGILRTETFTSLGDLSHSHQLSRSDVDEVSVEVIVDGFVWDKVDSFVNSQAGDRHFVVEVDHEGSIRIVFGDNFFGQAPLQNSLVTINYLKSIGAAGNVGFGSVRTIITSLSDVVGDPVDVSVDNPTAATGGEDIETLSHIKRQAPAELSALFRAMTKSDYIALSEGFPGIVRANAWGEQESNPPNYNMFNWVWVSVFPGGVTRTDLLDSVSNGIPSDQLKLDLLTYLKGKSPITTRVVIKDPEFVPIDIEINVYYKRGFLSNEVKEEVLDSLISFFDIDNISFNKEVRKSNIIKIIDSVSGVDYSEIVVFNTDTSVVDVENVIVANHYQMVYLRDLTINIERSEPIPTPSSVYPLPPAPPAPKE